MKLPKLIGHRGAASYAPENTLEGIRTAYDLGIDWVELDVKLTKDEIPILFHDEDTQRMSGVPGLVRDMTLDELKELDVGANHGESFIGTQIPTLDEALELLIDLDMAVNLEIKPCPGREKETAEILVDHLSRVWDEHNKVLLSSFQHVCLEICADMAPEWARGLLLGENWGDNWAQVADFLKVTTLNVHADSVTEEQVHSAIELGYPVLAFAVNDIDTAARLHSWGVHGFFSDEPDLILESGILTVH